LLSHIVNIGYIVHSDYRKIGVGSSLMENLIIEARKVPWFRILI